MRLLLLAALLFAEDPMSQVDALIRYEVPEEWEAQREDKRVTLTHGLASITVRLEGGEDADHPTMDGYAALLGRAERRAVRVAGAKGRLYKTFKPAPRHPHMKGPAKAALAQYSVLVPVDRRRFLIIEGSETTPKTRAVWDVLDAFLKTIKRR